MARIVEAVKNLCAFSEYLRGVALHCNLIPLIELESISPRINHQQQEVNYQQGRSRSSRRMKGNGKLMILVKVTGRFSISLPTPRETVLYADIVFSSLVES